MLQFNNFISELKKLRETSKHAVAHGNASNLDKFKEYLHIERPVETRLKNIVSSSAPCTNAQLILVCGNVGDGKSHILSYLNSVIGEQMALFTIHNDATESHNPNETSNDTLYRLLKGFRDDNIATSNDKIILAINLGTLSKFLENYEQEFTLLKEYVNSQKILENDLVEELNFESSRHIHHVNFTDYHLYSLSKIGAISETISILLQKIVNPSADNSIYKEYLTYKESYTGKYYCPILYNYEFLFNENNRHIIIQLIIKSIIVSKEIVSVRTLLNYIYDIIVPFELASYSGESYLEELERRKPTAYLSLLIPNYIFEHPELSKLFEKIMQQDPCNIRKESLDSILLKLANTEDPIVQFKKYIDQSYFQSLINIETTLQHVAKDEMSKFFIRLKFFSNYSKLTDVQDLVYDEYIDWLFHYNNHSIDAIEKIYNLAILAIKKWHGDTKSADKAIIKVGKKQNKYRIFKEVEPLPAIELQNECKDMVIHRFTQEFTLYFDIGTDSPLKINIDYSLFSLLQKIRNGYRPNKKDNNDYVYFVQNIHVIINKDSHKAPLYIDEVNIGKSIDYKLSKKTFGGYKFEII